MTGGLCASGSSRRPTRMNSCCRVVQQVEAGENRRLDDCMSRGPVCARGRKEERPARTSRPRDVVKKQGNRKCADLFENITSLSLKSGVLLCVRDRHASFSRRELSPRVLLPHAVAVAVAGAQLPLEHTTRLVVDQTLVAVPFVVSL